MKSIHFLAIAALLAFASCKPSSTNSSESQKDTANISAFMSTEAKADASAEAADQAPGATLPSSAVVAAETANRIIYTNVEREATDAEPADVVSVWIKDKKSGKIRKILVTNPMADLRWEDMRNRHAVEVTLDQVAAAEKALFLPWDDSKILVEGCPDARNIWTYVVDTDHKTAMQFPAKEGLTRFDESHHYLLMSDYRYHDEGGRYSVEETYTEDGAFVKEELIGDL